MTALVWIKLYADRLGEMRARRHRPAGACDRARGRRQARATAAADNFRNLFEVPVLFYVLCVALAVTGGSTPGLVAAAWVYVGLRALHSLIHVTYNRVMHRFLVYVASTLLLFGMWSRLLREDHGMSDFEGRCLCGAVRFALVPPTLFFAHCHCQWCREAHGAAFVSWVGAALERFRLLPGSAEPRWYQSSAAEPARLLR